jgi:hypothetical protein
MPDELEKIGKDLENCSYGHSNIQTSSLASPTRKVRK